MNLTQQQLAELARVSTPTVSRFEGSEKNIQLSTVLGILEVLGLADKRILSFPDKGFQRDSGDAITFYGQDGDLRIKCRISREALEDHFSERGRLKPDAAFTGSRAEIEALARRKYGLGQLEPDGSVLIRTLEIV